MRNVFFSLLTLFTFTITYTQPDPGICEDPDPITITTDCGTVFDLCIDRYIMDGEDHGMELKVFTNDMGLFDPCLSVVCEDCKHGELTKMDNCNYNYIPDPGFTGYDTFYYELVINDTCMIEDYCDDEDGKFWTLYSRYHGPDGADVEVYSKEGGENEFVDEVENLNWGDYFTIDGRHLDISQHDWEFRFFLEGNETEIPDTSIIVHTSCSQMILGVDFGYFNVISGCVSTWKDKYNCNLVEADRGSINTRAYYAITTQTIDTTMVVIEVRSVLPIEITGFSVETFRNENRLQWSILDVVNEEMIILEKSYNGVDFFEVTNFQALAPGDYNYIDYVYNRNTTLYYRLAIIGYNGEIKYSNIIMTHDEGADALVEIYPIPAKDMVHISVPSDGLAIQSYTVTDVAGKIIKSKYLNGISMITLSMGEDLNHSGFYLITLELTNGKEYQRKIMLIDN